jgi:acyl transferase domain-containing protein/acyl carrier protein
MTDRETLSRYLRRVSGELRDANRTIEELRRREREPIAIVGMSCRFPGGAASPEELWELVEDGADAIAPFPADRGWDLEALYDPEGRPGTSYVREGGFLGDVAEFDAGLFGISPRDALILDPQQRLLLEVAWETFEGAGIAPDSLAGSATGAFVGSMNHDYGREIPEEVEGNRVSGGSGSVLSGRLSYAFGLEGPAVTVDTACSSSLVAMHLAAQALRAGECELALAGGVSVLSTPWLFTEFSRQRNVARDARCKPFAAAADGSIWSEGCGLVLLERLSDARRNRHQVLALLRGSAVNQDGASNGLTAPNGPSQERVIRQALANAGLAAAEVDAVEAHGTGTALGDPIEAQALLATYGQNRGEAAPLALGSLKSNLGHAQAAAGIAGVIKMVQALRRERLPRTLHLEEPTPQVDWSAGEVELLRDERPWPRGDSPRRAGVSSFGVSGTNAHLILEEPPAEEPAPAPELPLSPLLLSAKDEGALRESGAHLAEHLRSHPEQGLAAVGATLATGRARLPHRAAVLAADREEAIAALQALGRKAPHPKLLEGRARGGRVCFLFPGQGSRWQGLGTDLLERSPVFRERIEECETALEPHLGFSVREALLEPSEAVEVVHPTLFAAMVGFAELWRANGVVPDAVLGHSLGEIAAACVAGALSLEDAARVVARRSAVLAEELAGKGGMVSVQLPAEQVEELISPWTEAVSVSALNSPHSTVVAGAPEALAELLARCEADGVRAREIAVDCASHSPQVEPVRERLVAELAPISPRPGRIPVYSAMTAEPIAGEEMGPEYWYRAMREPVRFAPAVGRLLSDGFSTFVEASAHPVLVPAVAECAAAAEREAAAIATLRREEDGVARFASALAEAHLAGAEPDWRGYFGERPNVPLPTYPFQRSRYWLEGTGRASDPAAIGQSDPEHPFLASLVALPDEEGWLATGRISPREHPWLADHVLLGSPVMPGTGFVELGLKAAAIAGLASIAELAIEAPMAIPEEGDLALQLRIGPRDERGERRVEVHSRPEADPEAEWVRHASGTLGDRATAAPSERLTEWPPAGGRELDLSDFYDRASELGIDYGPAFQGLNAAWRRGEELFAEVELDAAQEAEAGRFGVHPALLDAAVHSQLVSLFEGGQLRVPFTATGVALEAAGPPALRIRLAPAEGDADAYSLLACDPSGAPVVEARALLTRAVDPDQLRLGRRARGALYEVAWSQAPLAEIGEQEAGPLPLRLAADPDLDPPAAATALCEQVLAALQEAIAAEEQGGPVAFLTEGAVAASEGEVPDPALTAAWGLVRSAQAEHPGRFLLIDSDGGEASEAALAAALALEGETEIALREGSALVPRLAKAPEPQEDAPPHDPQGTALITGGTGTVGAHLARHLAATHGARHLVLTSRRGPEAPGAQELVAELAELGAEAEVRACDVSERSQLEDLLASLPPDRPLAAVLHAAGNTDDGLIGSLDAERLQNTMGPKATAAWHLHGLTREIPGCELVLFSSVAGTLQSPGQGNYAAANAFLDALAQQRAAEGLAGVSVGWGGWETKSELTGKLSEADFARLARNGIVPFPAAEGVRMYDRCRDAAAPHLLAAAIDRGQLRSAARAGVSPQPLLAGLLPTSARRAGAPAPGALAERLAAVPEPEREPVALELVRSHVAVVLGHASSEAVDPAVAFKDLGFDSLSAVELRNRLAAATGLQLPATLVFDHPSAEAVARHLVGTALGASPSPAEISVRPSLDPAEPIAIVGMSCRYPGGADSPEALWQLLEDGVDAIGPLPEDRGWDLEALYDPDPDSSGTSYAREGGFLGDVADFDTEFFGVSPREALVMDPQQRLLLEATWETLEAAGIDPASLAGSRTGVFTGAMHHDYGLGGSDSPEWGGYQGAVSTGAAISGRIAYSFGFEGPAVTVDTACSSSLVASHFAAQALRGGECDLALAGGVTVLSTPGALVEFSRHRGLSRDGRCKSFDAAADGIGMSEGVGLLLLERLSDARRNGHEVLALLRGSAINQDGASNGVTAPHGPSQERVIRQALAHSGLAPAEVDAVEAHGTGTPLGDPIEAQALLATYGRDRGGARPLLVGSLKPNIGHTQAAAGAAGMIKAILAMRHERLPRTIHLSEPTPHVDWSAGEVELLTEERAWERGERPRRVGISSFGAMGTNAHLVLEEAPATEAAPEPPEPPLSPLLLSAKDEGALRESAERLAGHLRAHPEQGLAAVGATLAATRSRLPRRAAVLGADREEAIAALEALGTGAPHRALLEGHARGGRVCFLFPGQGSQWRGMGAELLETSPAFAERIEECEAALAPHIGFSVREALEGPAYSEAVEVVQPVLFATMVSLAGLWREAGVEPAAVLGHSQGEIAAACVAGALSLDDAARVVALRSAVLAEELAGKGGMVSVQLPAPEVEELIGPWRGRVGIAAENSPHSTVVSGSPEALAELLSHCAAEEIRARQIAVDYASHSPQVEAARERLLAELAPISPRPSRVPVYSAMTASPIAGEEMGAEYWYSSMREPVRFAPAVSRLLADGFTTFVEASPHPVLVPAVAECAAAAEREAAAIGTLRREEGGEERFAAALAEAHLAGAEPDWERFFGPRAKVPLPTYPFQRSRYWLEGKGPGASDPTAIGQSDPEHPFLASLLSLPNEEGWLASGRISMGEHPWLADHVLLGSPVMPGTAFVELALKAAEIAGLESVAELAIESPMVVPEQGALALQLRIGPEDEEGNRPFEVHSRPEADQEEEWARHASGTLAARPAAAPEPLGAWPPPGSEELDLSEFYDRAAELGIDYGPAFQGLKAAWRRGAELFAAVELDAAQEEEAGRFGAHPALLDAAVHSQLVSLFEGGDLRVPFACADFRLLATGATSLRVRLAPAEGEADALSLLLADATGGTVAHARSLSTRPISPEQLSLGEGEKGALYAVRWSEAALGAPVEGAEVPEPVRLAADPDLAPPAAATALCGQALAALQEAIAAEDEGGPLAFLTEGAVAATEGEVPDPALTAAWGLVRSAQAEHPGRFLLLDSDGSEASEAAIAAALALEGETEIALREGSALVPRLAKAPEPEKSAPPHGEGTVLITGGTGTVGAHLARHLAATHGARHLVLTSRRGPEAPGAQELVAELAQLGAEAEVRACDVSERSQLEELLASLPADRPLAAVLHAAGNTDDGLVGSLDAERLQNTMGPKATAAWHLHELTREIPGCELVLFSSVAGTLQSPGQGNYAAANAFLDALAQQRAAEGLPGVSVGWGGWETKSELTGKLSEADMKRIFRSGVTKFSDVEGVAMHDRSRALGIPFLLAATIDKQALRAAARLGAMPPIFRGLVRAPARRAAGGSLAERLAAVPEPEREPVALELVRSHVAVVLGHASSEAIDPAVAFKDLGFDSLSAVELRNRLAAATGLQLPATLVFDHPSAEAVARYLVERAGGAKGPGVEEAIEGLRALLAALPEEERADADVQLRSLLARPGGDAEEAIERIEAADAEELLQIVNEEIGAR